MVARPGPNTPFIYLFKMTFNIHTQFFMVEAEDECFLLVLLSVLSSPNVKQQINYRRLQAIRTWREEFMNAVYQMSSVHYTKRRGEFCFFLYVDFCPCATNVFELRKILPESVITCDFKLEMILPLLP